MKAILVPSPGGPEMLQLGEIEKPHPKEREVLIKVIAAGINRADTLQRMGRYPPPAGASPVLGLEIAGVIEETGVKVSTLKKGDKIFGLIPGGGYAEYAVIHEDMAMIIPGNLSMTEAASIPEVFLTAYQSLIWHGKIKSDDYVLIHAGGSGVGTAAIQIAHGTRAHTITTASKNKLEKCIKLGAEIAIDYSEGSFVNKVAQLTGNHGVDVIIDFIGAGYFDQNIECLNSDGKLIILATLSGNIVEQFDLAALMKKRLAIIGSTLRSRQLDYQIKLTKEFYKYSKEKFESGKLKPVIDKVFNWEDVIEAHKYIESNKNFGKIVLSFS